MLTRVVSGLVVALALVGWSTIASPSLGADEQSGSAHGESSPNDHGKDPHASDGGAPVDPLSIKTDLALWTGIIFLVLLAVLWIFAWRPIANGLEKREKRIADDISSAKQSNAEARQLLEDYQQKLAEAGDEVRRMIEAARRDGEQAGQEIVEQAKLEIEKQHKRALEEIDLATDGALKELGERGATLAVELAGKIVGSTLDPAAHSRMIASAVADFSKQHPGNN